MKTLAFFTYLIGLTYAYEEDGIVNVAFGGEAVATGSSANSFIKEVTCGCGGVVSSQGQIHGVNEAGRNEFPWMAGLLQDWLFFCDAVVITNNHVMSSAHCTKEKIASQVFVALGYHNIGNFEEENIKLIQARHIHNHEKYDNPEGSTANDISIVVTQAEITFSKYISPICFPKKDLFTVLDRQKVKVAGWTKDEKVDNEHKTYHLRVVENTCAGDFGGIAMWLDTESQRYTLVGLVSYGVKMCGSNKHLTHTNVSYYLDWTLTILKDSGSRVCQKE